MLRLDDKTIKTILKKTLLQQTVEEIVKETMIERMLYFIGDVETAKKVWNKYNIEEHCLKVAKKLYSTNKYISFEMIYMATQEAALEIANEYVRDMYAKAELLEIIEELDRLYTIQKKTDIKQILKLRWEKLQRYSCKKLQLPPFKKLKPKARTVI